MRRKFGWTVALALAVCCALRLARFNARIDADEQPHKSAGFNTGVPAPAGAGLAFVPIYLWLITGNELVPAQWLCGHAPGPLFIAAADDLEPADLQLVVASASAASWRLFALAGDCACSARR